MSSEDPFAELLALLARDAPAEELHHVLQQAEERGYPRLEELREAGLSALGVRTLLIERRRRERELAALYETAGDLSSLRDVEAVLQAIVQRARQLLGSDAAYLMQNDDERGTTRMRVTDGIGTARFKGAELDLGDGLGGLVAATCTPYATADYAADARFVHTIDDVVSGEGLVAILGVPLRLREEVIGVLFAANRHERPFSREEVALLISLADHAAIAIENASLFQDVGVALEELREANSLIRAHSESVERAAALHERLAEVMLTGGRLPEVARAVADVLAVTLLVVDGGGRLLVAVGPQAAHLAPGDELQEAYRELVADQGPARGTTSRDGPDSTPVSLTPVYAGSDVLGTVMAVGRRLDAAEVRTLERAAVVTALVLVQARAVEEAEQRVRGEIVDDLLSVPQRDPEALLRRAAHLGIDLDRPYVVAVARPAHDGGTAEVVRACAVALAGDGGLSGQRRGDVVVLLPGAEPSAAAQRLARSLAAVAGCPVTVGAAGPGEGVAGLPELYRDATRCCDALLALDRKGEGAAQDDLGVYGLLFNQTGREELARFVRRTVGPVLDYDSERGSELARTLLAYYDCGSNLTRTAGALYVHVNTLYQRLDRVTALVGKDWRSGDTALQTHLALKVHLALDVGT